jgi:hypothetical protein
LDGSIKIDQIRKSNNWLNPDEEYQWTVCKTVELRIGKDHPDGFFSFLFAGHSPIALFQIEVRHPGNFFMG